ncbi:hypothetical protein FLONG3_7858 [Fusarium longipes]|uniref:Uncharacterized protein n=1 Tax=Fusarium longipes TaxID=694270 RepID=A0A395SAV9_9HYPO|nr:hypothetical protein FLONG3_7858 [Fusarium longipes]
MYEKSILKDILANLLADDTEGYIRRDVQAIIGFFDPWNGFHRQFKEWSEDPDDVKWPTWKENPSLNELRRIHRLLSRIVTFIEDYISKATSEYPPRAYLGLPNLKTGNISFKGTLLETKILHFTVLTRSERYRLLHAFVRYELLCNIHNGRDDMYHVSEGLCAFSAFGTPGAPDPKTLLSVHEYYKAMYGAVFAHCGDAWLPDLPSSLPAVTAREQTSDCTTLYRPLQYPDNLFFDAEEYHSDMEVLGSRVAAELAGCGLDLLTRVLHRLERDPRSSVSIMLWLYEIRSETEYKFRPWMHYLYDQDEDSAYRELRNGCYEDGINELHCLQLGIYRQRAWGLFDDGRFYPNTTSHFPTLDELVGLWHDSQESRSKDSNWQRRSKSWQDYWAGKRSDRPTTRTTELDFSGRLARFFDDKVVTSLPSLARRYYCRG